MGNHNYIWAEKYRPTKPKDFIGNEKLVEDMNKWIESQDLPHLIFYGKPGTGKTTLAQLLSENIEADVKYINASEKTGVDFIRDEIIPFANSIGFLDKKIVILDEFDYMSPNAMASLRNVMESSSKHTRFILTCNYIEKVIEAIMSRTFMYNVIPPTMAITAKKIAEILDNEGITYELNDIKTVIEKTYPDIRKAIQTSQQYTDADNKKLVLTKESEAVLNYMPSILNVLKSKNESSKHDKLKEIRQIINDEGISRFEDLYTYLYNNIDEIVSPKQMPSAMITLAKYQQMDVMVLDKEINIMAMFAELLENK